MFRSIAPRRERSMFPAAGRFTNMMKQVGEETEDLMERFWGGNEGWLTGSSTFSPTADLVETENQFEVTVDLPGLKPEEVSVELKNGDLWISGKREELKEEKGKTYHRLERHHGEFRRVLRLPNTISEDGIDAHFEDGVLKVTVPKVEEAKSKHIEVRA